MPSKSEELLNFLLWSAEKLTQPTFRNLTESYESWAYRNGFMRQLQNLERRRLVERDRGSRQDLIYRLTSEGRLRSLGGRDPEACWSRPWDGRWRFILFDIPTAKNSQRAQLRRYLRGKCFGRLQQSAWITPDPLEKERVLLREGRIEVDGLFLLEGRPCGGESDEEIVAGGWDFERLNELYSHHLTILSARPNRALVNRGARERLRRWAAAERHAWSEAVESDPLLPERLLPNGYLGRAAWRRRIEVLQESERLLQTFPGQEASA